MKTPRYLEPEVTKSYRWLGHYGRGWTELGAYHPAYVPGKEHFEENRKNGWLPKTWHGKSEKEVLKFVRRYVGERIVCYSLNLRPEIYRNKKGYARSAREAEITTSQSLLQDFDVQREHPSKAHLKAVYEFLQKANPYFVDLGFYPPAKGFSGGGFHQLFAYPPINVEEHPDIAQRLKAFNEQFRKEFRQELQRLEVRLDSTADLRRMVKIYGTAKPGSARLSKFYGTDRLEDENLSGYLLSMDLDAATTASHSGRASSGLVLKVQNEVPLWFMNLIQQSEDLRALWEGKGKSENADISRSGYEFNLVRTLLKLGYRNLDELATILALRPGGDVQERGKSEQYIRRTIGNALLR